MTTLLLRLEGALQSWSSGIRFSILPTEAEPTKSGVVGLVCAAMGVARDDRDTIGRLAVCGMTVRADREGVVLRDYHTTGGGRFDGEAYGVFDPKTRKPLHVVPSERFYLADASFLVALEGDDALLARARGALQAPVWQVSLGRKACVPSTPVFLSLERAPASECVRAWTRAERAAEGPLRLTIEARVGRGQARDDVPIAFEPKLFGRRYVETAWTDPPALRRAS